MIVLYTNDSVSGWIEVFNSTNITMSGGSLSYVVNHSGTYGVMCFFKRVGFDVFYFGSLYDSLTMIVYTLDLGSGSDSLDDKITDVMG